MSESTSPQNPPPWLCDDCSDDFEFITHEDLPIRLDDPPLPPSGLPSTLSRTELPATPHCASLKRTSVPSTFLHKFASSTRTSILSEVASRFKKRAKQPRLPIPLAAQAAPQSLSRPAERGRDSTHPLNLGDRLKSITKVAFSVNLHPRRKGAHNSLAGSLATDPTPKFSVEVFQVSPSPTEPSSLPPVYDCVNPFELTASPSPLLGSDLFTPSARTSFVPPSPSWLSRNVRDRESLQLLADHEPETSVAFTSFTSLPAPPRILISSHHSESPPLSPLEATEDWLSRPLSLKPRRSRSLSSLRSRKSSGSSTKCSVSTGDSFKENRSGKITVSYTHFLAYS